MNKDYRKVIDQLIIELKAEDEENFLLCLRAAMALEAMQIRMAVLERIIKCHSSQ